MGSVLDAIPFKRLPSIAIHMNFWMPPSNLRAAIHVKKYFGWQNLYAAIEAAWNKSKCRQTESCKNGSSCPSRQSETIYLMGIGVEIGGTFCKSKGGSYEKKYFGFHM